MKIQALPRLISQVLVYAVLLMALAIPGLAQITTTGIRGIVRDPNGAVIANAASLV